jgi:hypothetical protein
MCVEEPHMLLRPSDCLRGYPIHQLEALISFVSEILEKLH